MQRAAAEMLAHHQQLAALEHDRHTSMLQNMQVRCSAMFILLTAGLGLAHLQGALKL